MLHLRAVSDPRRKIIIVVESLDFTKSITNAIKIPFLKSLRLLEYNVIYVKVTTSIRNRVRFIESTKLISIQNRCGIGKH